MLKKIIKKPGIVLLLLFLFTLALRLYFGFSTPNFTYDSYFHLRQVGEIAKTGWPVYQDSLSYGGRELVFLPGFQYLLAFFSLFLPLELVGKIVPNILLSFLVILVYLIAKRVTKGEEAALVSSAIAAFTPIFWQTNSISPFSLFLLLSLLAIYSFISLEQKKFLYTYLFSIFLLSLITPATFLLITGLLLYLLLAKLEEKRIKRAELELSLFSLFFFLWLQFLFFKDILLAEGPRFIWQNIPSQMVSQYFPRFSALQSLIFIGIIPLLAGIYMIYKLLFREKNRRIFLLFSLALSTIFLFILNLVELGITLMFLALIFALIFSQFYQILKQYLKQTKLRKLSLAILTLLLLLTSVYPSVSLAREQATPSAEEINAFLWLKENTPEDSTILATLREGHLLTYQAQRKNFMDGEFSLIKNIEGRFNDLNSLFITQYQTQAIDLLERYGIDYIFFSPQARKEYGIESLAYIDEKCFELVYSNVVQIYKSKCRLEPTR